MLKLSQAVRKLYLYMVNNRVENGKIIGKKLLKPKTGSLKR